MLIILYSVVVAKWIYSNCNFAMIKPTCGINPWNVFYAFKFVLYAMEGDIGEVLVSVSWETFVPLLPIR